MSKTNLNALTHKYSGKFGNHFIFRNVKGKSVMAALPDRKNTQVSEAQLAVRRKFASAARYAKKILLDPDMLIAYMEKANINGQSPHLVAMTDYLRDPWIEEIDIKDYNGNSGEIIRVMAGDDFKVVEVSIKVIDAAGVEAESGPCQLDSHDVWWEYTTSQEVVLDPGVEIVATAIDIPGHTGESSYLYE